MARLVVLLSLVAGVVGCGSETGDPLTSGMSPESQELPTTDVDHNFPPSSVTQCRKCHAEIVDAFLNHGMVRSLAPVGEVRPSVTENPRSGARYEITHDDRGPVMVGSMPGGGQRRQRLVGRIGAGVMDTSWVAAEIDQGTGLTTGRLFFAPVEEITNHGAVLSPFEHLDNSAGPNRELTQACLHCHTDDRVTTLPNAAPAVGNSGVFPANELGVDAFAHLSPLTCDSCHGDSAEHMRVADRISDPTGDVGIERLAELPAPVQRDVCSRCHLEGIFQVPLTFERPNLDSPLCAQVPVLVADYTGDDYRFVSQMERLAMSPCFTKSEHMTCTTCHDPHRSVTDQGVASFDAACLKCHPDSARKHTDLSVESITGEAPRSDQGCVDCHVRRSQPYDLPHLRTADHNVRRQIPLPETLEYRLLPEADAELRVYDDGRLQPILETEAGRRWHDAVVAIGLAATGRTREAADYFAEFPPPGTEAARTPTAPEGLLPVATHPMFHKTRAVALLSEQDISGAIAALGDALLLAPERADIRTERAQMLVASGNTAQAREDCEAVLEKHPTAAIAWLARGAVAMQTGDSEGAITALENAGRQWPSDPSLWRMLGMLYERTGRSEDARAAVSRAERLQSDGP